MNERIDPKATDPDIILRQVDKQAPAIFVRFSANVGPNSQMELSFGIPLDMTPRDLNTYVDKVSAVTERQQKKGLLAHTRIELENRKKQLYTNIMNRAEYEAKQATDWATRGKRGDWEPNGQERAQIATFTTNDKALREDQIPLLEKQIEELEAEINENV